MVGRVVLAGAALLCGGSIGREGPTVHVGAVIVNGIARWMPKGRMPAQRHAMVLAGGAAGVAAAFNTPLAGIVFAIEELSRSFEERASGTTLTAVILAGVVAIALVGDYTYFGQPQVAARAASVTPAVLLVAGYLRLGRRPLQSAHPGDRQSPAVRPAATSGASAPPCSPAYAASASPRSGTASGR